jgi:hypothetical protein
MTMIVQTFKSILHFKRTFLSAELKVLCQLQFSQQVLFTRNVLVPRRGWLRDNLCGGSDGRPGLQISACTSTLASCADRERAGSTCTPAVQKLMGKTVISSPH